MSLFPTSLQLFFFTVISAHQSSIYQTINTKSHHHRHRHTHTHTLALAFPSQKHTHIHIHTPIHTCQRTLHSGVRSQLTQIPTPCLLLHLLKRICYHLMKIWSLPATLYQIKPPSLSIPKKTPTSPPHPAATTTASKARWQIHTSEPLLLRA